MPKVTVLMTVYNGEKFVHEAINSILTQTLQDFEFLIINDGSTDQTRNIISSYKDSRIILIDNDSNLGITRSLNRGLNLAQGEFIARLDSDDIAEPERLARQVSFLEANPNVTLVGSWYRTIDEQGNILEKHTLPCDCIKIRWGLLFYTPFIHSSVTFRKDDVLQKVGLYNEDFIYTQDHELWVRIAKIFPVANLDEYLMQYRVHASSVTLFHETHQYDLLFQNCISYMSTVLNYNQSSEAIDKEIFRKMQFLLNYSEYQDWKIFDFRKLKEIIQIIFKLSQAFCDYYNLAPHEQRRHHLALVSCLSGTLVNLASTYSYDNRYTTWQLLAEAYFLNKANLFSRRYQVTLLKLLAGPYIMRTVRNIRPHKRRSLSK
jgi:glycosyltransferase involved in cell wall biosynthesis